MRRVFVPLDIAPPAPALHCVTRGLAGETMGTTWSVKIAIPAGRALEPLHAGIQRELDQVVAQMSTWDPNSDLSRFNQSPPGSWQTLPEEFFHVLDYALDIARETNGAYDPTSGSLVNLWGFGPDATRSSLPDRASVADARSRCGWQRLALDPVDRRAMQPGGVYVDLSSIAKGFGVDRVASYLQDSGVESYLIEVGGELRGYGVKPDGSPWLVSIEQTDDTVLALHGLSIATSGDYRRYFESSGTRYSHTVDPRTGHPVANRLASVTVVHRECMAADALSTALTVLGPNEGWDYACGSNLAALFIERQPEGFQERMTPNLAAMLD